MYDLFVVFNTCGISGRDNTGYYVQAIQTLLNQNFDSFRVIVSSCCNHPMQIQRLKESFGNKIDISIINEVRTVNTTFNKTVQEAVKVYGEAKGYLYADSGCAAVDRDTLSHMFQHVKDYGMVTCATDTDTGFNEWLGSTPTENFIMPIGRTCNLHFQIFNNKIFQRYGRIIPDIFASYCTESVFSFLNASVDMEWIVLMDKIVRHAHGIDLGSSGFREGLNWRHMLYGYNIETVINDPEAVECGFGYEEIQHIKDHNPHVYVGNKCKDPERLAKFMERSVFLPKSLMNYDDIKCEYIKG